MIYDKIAKMKQKGYVTMVTNFGNINIELHTDITPMVYLLKILRLAKILSNYVKRDFTTM
jgi:hypothetical protein